MNPVLLSSLEYLSQSYTEYRLAYQADVRTYLKIGEIHCTDLREHAEK